MPTDTYLDISAVSESLSMQRRVSACAAQQNAPGDPWTWMWNYRLTWASAPGWGAAWGSALAADNPDPGADPAVITDGMILTQVQGMLNAQ